MNIVRSYQSNSFRGRKSCRKTLSDP